MRRKRRATRVATVRKRARSATARAHPSHAPRSSRRDQRRTTASSRFAETRETRAFARAFATHAPNAFACARAVSREITRPASSRLSRDLSVASSHASKAPPTSLCVHRDAAARATRRLRIRPRAVARQPLNAAVSRRRSQRSRMAPTRAGARRRADDAQPRNASPRRLPSRRAAARARQHGAPLSPDPATRAHRLKLFVKSREVQRATTAASFCVLSDDAAAASAQASNAPASARRCHLASVRADDRPRAAARGGAVQPPVERRRQPRVRVAREEARQRGPPAPHLRRGVAPRVEGADDGAAAPPLEHVRHHQSGATRESRVIRPRRERRG